MAMGGDMAKTASVRQFELIEQSLASLDPAIWKDERNVRAAAVYLLCGGSPAKLRKIYDAKLFPDETGTLLNASLTYAEGKGALASKLLVAFDARRYPAMLGGHLALVQGGLVIATDKAGSVSLLDLARLLMPASLVEEAALRREVAILDPVRDTDKLLLLGSRYVDKYFASPYAMNFWDQLRAAIIAAAPKMDAATIAKLELLLDKSSAGDKSEFHLTVARAEILAGKLAEADARVAKADGVAETDAARRRVKAYRSALRALSDDASRAASELAQIDLGQLSRADADMLKRVSGVVARLDTVAADKQSMQHASNASDADAATSFDSPILVAAQQALEQSDALLKRATRP